MFMHLTSQDPLYETLESLCLVITSKVTGLANSADVALSGGETLIHSIMADVDNGTI
ncbi:hypothetical protein Hamer_G023551, partial [Homarus americanus]